MIWVFLLLVAAVILTPLALSLLRAPRTRGRREAEMALHRATLAGLDRDLAEGRLDDAAHRTARAEVARRLLAADAAAEKPAQAGAVAPQLVLAGFIVVGAAGLYLISGGVPGLPSVPVAERRDRDQAEAALLDQLRARLAALDPSSEQARQGFLLLGNAELSRGNGPGALDAWKRALRARFDPALAVQVAEVMSLVEGRVSDEARGLARRALETPGLPEPLREVAGRLAGG